jgi:ribosomal protein S18 acetylase RimI-like enzyme
MRQDISVIIAGSAQEFEDGKLLFKQYASTLGFDLSFQKFDSELDSISAKYNAPVGALLLAYDQNKPVACAGVRQIDENTAELKRMFVIPEYRGQKLGEKLLVMALQVAKDLQYKTIRLDTFNNMTSAIKLYRAYGFYDIEPYYYNPLDGALFLEKEL